jgi:Rap1a immunity proteins
MDGGYIHRVGIVPSGQMNPGKIQGNRTSSGALMRTILVGGAFLFFSLSVVHAMSGDRLYEACNNKSHRAGLMAYISGVWDKAGSDYISALIYEGMQHKGEKMLSTSIKNACPADNVTIGQMADVICKYLKDNPAERHKLAADLVTQALDLAFRCEKGK